MVLVGDMSEGKQPKNHLSILSLGSGAWIFFRGLDLTIGLRNSFRIFNRTQSNDLSLLSASVKMLKRAW